MKLTVSADVKVPKVPNFLRLADGQVFPLDAMSDDDLRRIGEAWTQALIKRAHEIRLSP